MRQSLTWWEEYFKSVSEMPFLCGKNKRSWMADLGWLITRDNMVKVLEGNYQKLVGGKAGAERNDFDKRDYQKGATKDENLPCFLRGDCVELAYSSEEDSDYA